MTVKETSVPFAKPCATRLTVSPVSVNVTDLPDKVPLLLCAKAIAAPPEVAAT